ncbi:hypothetical protein [Paraburkholderia sp. RL17-381-BIF-C]|uniref:hypothetical protein n=1 Tax=Paraburkholderia sp. RL17-381-BIF-C TaxID=3031635 RepID=UPI0038B79922
MPSRADAIFVVSSITCFTHAPSLANPKISDVDLNAVMPRFLICVLEVMISASNDRDCMRATSVR